jgi:hypothetical protein
MNTRLLGPALGVGLLSLVALTALAEAESWRLTENSEVLLKGSMVCNGACISDPKTDDHGLVLFAIDGTPEIRAEVDRIMKDFYPDRGLDAAAAQKLMDQFSARLKYYLAPDSPALKGASNTGKNHYCMPALASAVTGVVHDRHGKKWISAT